MHTELNLPNPKLLVKAVNTWVRSAFGNVYYNQSLPAQARHRPRPPHWQAVAARGHATDSAGFYIF